nr:MAG TPA: hypothetical protein [Bacteriophage sp.]
MYSVRIVGFTERKSSTSNMPKSLLSYFKNCL